MFRRMTERHNKIKAIMTNTLEQLNIGAFDYQEDISNLVNLVIGQMIIIF